MLYGIKKLAVSVTLAASIVACSTSPTGRSQLLLFSGEQLASSGAQAFKAMKEQQKVNTDRATNLYVKCIANAITAELSDSQFSGEWEIIVFEEPSANAFALPGGKIGVHTGLLDVATNQHQLAAVIGHEVAHVIAEHGNERMSQAQLIGMTQAVAQSILESQQVSSSKEIMAALGLGVSVGFVLPYNRSHESEADELGLELMAKAGFEPEESVSLWQNMAKLGGNRQPEFLSTHPSPDSRIAALQASMPKALELYNSSAKKPNCG